MEKETPIEKVSSWIKHSIMLKLITITVLMLLLLIPASMIKSIIHERQYLNDQAIREVSSKWAERQEITGPILTIPLIYEYEGKDGNMIQTTKYWNLLPERLDITGFVEPEKLRRGIYEVVVYESKVEIEGIFKLEELDKTNLKEIRFNHSFLTIGISDLRGIKNQVSLNWKDKKLEVKPGSKITDLIYTGITIELPNIKDLSDVPADFKFTLDLQGSQNLSFVPVGSQTTVKLNSSWDSPSFNGNFLPDQREVTADGFTAEWNVLQLNRNYPQSWIGKLNSKGQSDNQAYAADFNGGYSALSASAFGVDLILPLDDYQKSMRSAKYAVMTIALTFLIFFLVEILNKRKIHPFQYVLVGLGLCVFYILLVSITEHSHFNLAYGISTLSVVTMISLYSLSVFKMKRLTYLVVLILVGIYGFLFVTLQLSDYALLMGSLGLFIILALTMYFTRNINWYQLNIEME